jgi:hypothetical protein
LAPRSREDSSREIVDLSLAVGHSLAVNDTLKGQFDLEHHGVRSTTGVAICLAQCIVPMATANWYNIQTGTPTIRSLIGDNIDRASDLLV